MNNPNRHFPSPNEFYRAQRPERFSDSVVIDKPSLNRSQLEFHLSTLTSRSQELDFESFARGLAELRIAPNLIPHTGPTGGGDSKVDSETFPVSDALALTWYQGIGREAASERWAFAFSAKKDWRSKVKSDIAKLVATERAYKKAFFFTNQYVKDKDRSKLEDELSKAFALDVRILDLTWTLDTVFTGRHESLAIDALRLSPTLRPEVVQGPRDLKRERRLEDVETRIQEALSSGQLDITIVQDALRSATTARGLERPRTDIDGRFFRARQLAERLDVPSDLLRIVYEWAWTSFFWFEDYDVFANLAKETLELALRTESATSLELATTLHGLIHTATSTGRLTARQIDLDDFVKALLGALDRVASNQERQSNALHAKTLAIQVRLVREPKRATALLKEMKRTLERARLMIGYPFEETADLIGVLEPYFGHLSAYTDLFERIVDITANRKGEVAAAQLLLKRGAQQLEREADTEAIRNIGRALGRLYKNESRDDLIRALYLAGAAYARIDLLWAARGSLVIAASLAVDEFHKFNRITREQVACYDRLRWVELQLGRLPQALEWHQLFALTHAVVSHRDADTYDMFDAVLGIEMLKADPTQLRQLEALPDVFEGLGLYMAKSALLFALGHPSELPQDLLEGKDHAGAERDFMKMWRDQPAAAELRTLSLGLATPQVLESDILGCHVRVDCENRSPAIDLAESLLGAIEALFSTGLDSRMLTREPTLAIEVNESEFAEDPLGYKVEYLVGRPHVRVACRRFDHNSLPHATQQQVKTRLHSLLIDVFAHIIALPDNKKGIRQLFRDERALERAIDFTNVFVTLGNVLGHHPKTSVIAWTDPAAKRYPLLRTEVWDSAERSKPPTAKTREEGSGSAVPPEAPDFPPPKRHSQLRTVSLIRERLWNEAGWVGVGFVAFGDQQVPPIMALLFRNSKAALQIFQGFQEDLGGEDRDGLLRISVVRGISASHPAHYRMVIGAELDAIKHTIPPLEGRLLVIERLHTMEPTSSENLDRFLTSFEQTKSYVLAPGLVDDPEDGFLLGEPQLRKRQLVVRDAWQIGRHDIDSSAVLLKDDIAIPASQPNAPVKELLRWLRKRRR